MQAWQRGRHWCLSYSSGSQSPAGEEGRREDHGMAWQWQRGMAAGVAGSRHVAWQAWRAVAPVSEKFSIP